MRQLLANDRGRWLFDKCAITRARDHPRLMSHSASSQSIEAQLSFRTRIAFFAKMAAWNSGVTGNSSMQRNVSARTIATTLVAQVSKAEAERTLLKPPANWQSYEYFVRGADILAGYWSTIKVADLHESRRQFESSLAIDPAFTRAYWSLSTTYVIA
jgi:hypothetical protein